MTKKQRKDKQVNLFRLLTSKGPEGTVTVRQYLTEATGERKRFWAYFRALSGDEVLKADAEVADCTAEFRMNWNPRVERDMYIEMLSDGKVYNIRYVDPFEGYRGDMKISARLEGRVPGGDDSAVE